MKTERLKAMTNEPNEPTRYALTEGAKREGIVVWPDGEYVLYSAWLAEREIKEAEKKILLAEIEAHSTTKAQLAAAVAERDALRDEALCAVALMREHLPFVTDQIERLRAALAK